MADHFPDYDVLAKRGTPSWDAKTRAVIDRRLALGERTDVLDEAQRATLRAIADRIVPQPEGRPAVNTAALVLDKIAAGGGERPPGLPRIAEAWSRGLDAVEAEAQARHQTAFAALEGRLADALLAAVQHGEAPSAAAWRGMSPGLFWQWRLIPDIVSAYYSHPSAWSAMGYGGPASPRGYVRLGLNRRDPWEAAEAGSSHLVGSRTRNRNVT